METKEYLRIIAEDLKTCVIATVDADGRPVTCVIDIMDHDDEGLYFITGRGKALYSRLMNSPYVGITLMKGDAETEYLAVSIRGHAEETGTGMLRMLFDKNPVMYKLYPDQTKWEEQGLTVFRIDSGSVEWLAMSTERTEREIFTFGD